MGIGISLSHIKSFSSLGRAIMSSDATYVQLSLWGSRSMILPMLWCFHPSQTLKTWSFSQDISSLGCVHNVICQSVLCVNLAWVDNSSTSPTFWRRWLLSLMIECCTLSTILLLVRYYFTSLSMCSQIHALVQISVTLIYTFLGKQRLIISIVSSFQ